MTHPAELLSAYLDGELTAPEQARVAGHLRTCVPCREDLADLNSARASLRSLSRLEPPTGLVPDDSVLVPLRRKPPVWAAVAAAIVALFIGIATILSPSTALEVRLDQLTDQYGARNAVDPGISPAGVMPVVYRVTGPGE